MQAQQPRTWHLLAAAATLTILAGACSTTREGSANVYTGTEAVPQAGEVTSNSLLARKLSIVDPRSRRIDGRLVVEFRLVNNRVDTVEFAWAVDWFDQAGFVVADATRHFEPVELAGGAQTTLHITAPRPEATTWKLQVQSPNEVR